MSETIIRATHFCSAVRHGCRSLFAVTLFAVAALGAQKAIAQYDVPQIAAPQEHLRLDVPYVPTPQLLVDRMLEIAQVKPGDLVMDVGCGDGRMVVTAAEKFGARGIGVDIDPKRIAEANENARAAGVSDKVEFRVGNLYEVDISQADVLAMYLLNEINLRLRPTILKTMKPGSRIVSHAFHMGDWKADHEETVAGRTVYFWVVPAQAAGRWQVRHGERRIDLALSQKNQFLTGKATEKGRKVTLREGRVNGHEISYVLETQPGGRQTYRGRIDGDSIVALGDDPTPWRATRPAR